MSVVSNSREGYPSRQRQEKEARLLMTRLLRSKPQHPRLVHHGIPVLDRLCLADLHGHRGRSRHGLVLPYPPHCLMHLHCGIRLLGHRHGCCSASYQHHTWGLMKGRGRFSHSVCLVVCCSSLQELHDREQLSCRPVWRSVQQRSASASPPSRTSPYLPRPRGSLPLPHL